MDIAQLQTELQTDPLALGYDCATLDAAGWREPKVLAAKLNAPLTGAPSDWDQSVSGDALRIRVAKSEFLALQAGERAYLDFLLRADAIDLGYAPLRAELAGLFGPQSATRAAWLAIVQRKVSRAEQLFGVGTVVTHHHVDEARLPLEAAEVAESRRIAVAAKEARRAEEARRAAIAKGRPGQVAP